MGRHSGHDLYEASYVHLSQAPKGQTAHASLASELGQRCHQWVIRVQLSIAVCANNKNATVA